MPTIQNIEENEYGNVSRPKINSNFQELETAVDNLDTNKENTFAQLPLTKGGLGANLESLDCILGVKDGAIVQITNRTLLTQFLSDLTNIPEVAGQVWTGEHNFGGATKLRVPQSSNPVVSVNGDIAVDTDVSWFTHGLPIIFAGSELAFATVLRSDLDNLQNGSYLEYATDKFVVSNRIQRKHLTATVSRTSTTTLADVTEFTFTLEAGGIYMLHGMINFKSEPAGIKQAYRGTATTTGFVMAHLTNNTIQTYTDIDNAPTSVDISTSLTNSSEAIHGIVNVGATAGTLVYRFAQNTSNATSTSLFTGSYLTLTKLN